MSSTRYTDLAHQSSSLESGLALLCILTRKLEGGLLQQAVCYNCLFCKQIFVCSSLNMEKLCWPLHHD